MKMMNLEAFFNDFGKAAPNTMNLSMYRDDFKCACGDTHWFDERIDILCQGYWKLVIFCPDNSDHLTSVKIKTILGIKFKGFESLAGCETSTFEDRALTEGMRKLYRGRGAGG